jgi:hypothetical protein
MLGCERSLAVDRDQGSRSACFERLRYGLAACDFEGLGFGI